MRLMVLLLLGWLVLSAGAQVPQIRYASFKLKNGLRVYLVEDHFAPIVTVQVYYKVGSRDERKGRTGFAHLFEHLMFKGSEHVEPEEHSRILQAIGGISNADTGLDRTRYWQTVPSSHLELVLWLEADRMRSLKVDEQNFQTEREVVKEERRLTVDNQPYGKLFDLALAAAFPDHPYDHPPIGTMDDLNAAHLEDVQAFHREFYTPDDAFLIIAGDFDPKQVKAWVEKYFGDIPKSKNKPNRRAVSKIEWKEEKRQTVSDPLAALPLVTLVYHAPPPNHSDFPALQVLANALFQGESSRAYREIVRKEQLAPIVEGDVWDLALGSIFVINVPVNMGKSPEEVEKALNELIVQAQKEGIQVEELEKARNRTLSDLVFGRVSVEDRAETLGEAIITYGKPDAVNKQYDRIRRVGLQDVRRVAQKYLTPQNRLVIYTLPAERRGSGQ